MHLRPAMELTSYVSSKCGYRLWASLIESQLFLISGCPALHWGAGVSSSGGSGTSLMPSASSFLSRALIAPLNACIDE